MPNIALTELEIKEVTGYVSPKKQVEALLVMGIPFKIRPNGRPFVARAIIENNKEASLSRAVVKDL